MSLSDYELARQIANSGVSLEVVVMAAFLRAAMDADADSLALLRAAFPDIHAEVAARAISSGGRLETDPPEVIL